MRRRVPWSRLSSLLVSGLVAASLASTAAAQILPPTAPETLPSASADPNGLLLNLSDRAMRDAAGLDLGLNAPLTDGLDSWIGPRIDLPADAIGSTLFRLDLSNPGCLSGDRSCVRRDEGVSLGVSEYITAKKDSGIDLVLRPRASFRVNEDSRSALVGAVVEIGEDLRRGSDIRTNTWYLFAGADAEALTYSPESLRSFSSGNFHLQDRIIVGDAQAGVGYRLGDADVSLSYLRREANAEGLSYNEDAAALSFTWKR
ncbi:MAG: hypothetical protein WBG08_06255 [Litorimonas sp.]